MSQVFKKYGIPKLPLPARETVSLFRKNYSKALARFNDSPFIKKALSDGSSWTEKDISISVRDGSSIPTRLYIPNELPQGGAPVAVFLHGGGWFMGSLDTEAYMCRLLATKFRILVASIGYRIYPEVNFPIPSTDSYDGVRWVSCRPSIQMMLADLNRLPPTSQNTAEIPRRVSLLAAYLAAAHLHPLQRTLRQTSPCHHQ